MKRQRLPMVRETIDFLKEHGVRDIELCCGSKHLKVRFKFANQNLVTIASFAPPANRRAGDSSENAAEAHPARSG